MIRALPLLLALALWAPLAAAHASHHACGEASHDTNDSLLSSRLHANAWTGSCAGAVVSWDIAACVFGPDEPSAGPLHAHALEGDGCRTGVLVELP